MILAFKFSIVIILKNCIFDLSDLLPIRPIVSNNILTFLERTSRSYLYFNSSITKIVDVKNTCYLIEPFIEPVRYLEFFLCCSEMKISSLSQQVD